MFLCQFVGVFRIRKALEVILSIFVLLFINDSVNEKTGNNSGNLEIKIVKEGTGVVIECRSCNGSSLVWTHKPPNGVPADIVTGKEPVRKDNQADQWFNIAFDNNICINKLQINNIQINKAGAYTCLKDLNIMRTYVIVIKDNFRCLSKPDFPKTILLKPNSTVTINCTFQYSADESCIATPIWIDLTGYRNFTMPSIDFDASMTDSHTWINFKPGAEITNGTYLNLSFVFSCSFSNNSQDKYEVLNNRYDFGQVPFTLFVEVEKGTTNNMKTPDESRIKRMLTTGIITAMAILTVFLFPMLIWKIYRSYKLINSTEIDASVVGKALPDIPMIASYSLEHLGAPKLPPRRNIVEFRSPEEATYEVIKD